MRDDIKKLAYRFSDVEILKNAYMSFVRDGGIFIPTQHNFHLGDVVTLNLTLPDSEQTFTFIGEVIWITPASIQQALHHQGVGIQCKTDEGEAFHRAIQQLFVGTKMDGDHSDTM